MAEGAPTVLTSILDVEIHAA